MFFSTYIYVFRLLEKKGVNIETIPGIPAFIAIGSHLGWPIVEGNDVLSIIPATADKETIEKVMSVSDNVVLMKVYKNFPEIADLLVENKMIDNAVMVSRVGMPDEERIDDILARKDQPVNYLSTVLARRTPEK
jgi:precorrin-2/cobalt-factor-2 C20-methyltransferase